MQPCEDQINPGSKIEIITVLLPRCLDLLLPSSLLAHGSQHLDSGGLSFLILDIDTFLGEFASTQQ